MRTTFLLAVALTLGAMLAPATARASEGEAPSLQKRPEVRRWKVGGFGEFRKTLVGDGGTITHGLDLSYEVRPHVRVGGSLVLPFAALPGECYQTYPASDCTFNSVGLLGFAELHGSTEFPLDPWIRAGVGGLVHASRWGVFTGFDFAKPDIQVFASAGLDVNVGPVYVGWYGTIAAFLGEQAHLGGGGMHIGARF